MPPKKAEPKKTEQKKAQKVVEDKTFGMKNKKGAQNQKKIQQMQKQIVNKGMSANKVERMQQAAAGDSKKDKQKKELDELNDLFKPVIVQQQNVEKGVDPKSVLCVFFKQGQCTKGEKCKFSHDLNVVRRAEKKNIYEDVRSGEGEGQDTMDGWDEAKLNEVVERKHGEQNRGLPATTIICKFFLEAVEQNKYGWFWECPNGGNRCHYKHALPAGYILKRDRKRIAEAEKEDELTLEDLIEKERASLGPGTKITLETFLAWKQRKKLERIQKAREDADRRKEDFKKGRLFGISGRELFEFDPNLINETTDADDTDQVVDSRMCASDGDDTDGYSEQLEVHTIDLDAMMRDVTDVNPADDNPCGTLASEARFEEYRMMIAEREASLAAKRLERVQLDDEAEGDEAGSQTASAASVGDKPGTSREVDEACEPIDEDLFNDDDGDEGDDERYDEGEDANEGEDN